MSSSNPKFCLAETTSGYPSWVDVRCTKLMGHEGEHYFPAIRWTTSGTLVLCDYCGKPFNEHTHYKGWDWKLEDGCPDWNPFGPEDCPTCGAEAWICDHD